MWTILSFEKRIDKNHPGMAFADAWKKSLQMKFIIYDKLEELLHTEQGATISVKLDGELVALVYQHGKVEVVTNKGTVRTNMPATDEAAKLLSGHKSGVFLAELYAVDEHNIPESYMKAASVLRDPKLGVDDRIRLSVFDMISLDDKEYTEENIDTKMDVINKIFEPGKYARPAYTIKGGIQEAKNLWDQLDQRGWEGLIIHFAGDTYKVKPLLSYDMVIVAVTKSPTYIDRIGAVLTSFIDKSGRFRLNGLVGGGFNDEERVQLMEWAERNKVMEDDDRIWVDPFKEPLVVEIQAMEVNVKDRPKLEYRDGKWVEIEDDISGVLRFPQFKRFRDDKEPKYPDVRIEQLPIERMSAIEFENVLRAGNRIKTITGFTGTIQSFVPWSGDSGMDFDIIVKWDEPMFGVINICEVHPSEIVEIIPQ